MQFQKAHVSIVRSIRQVSLVRDWQRSRGNRELPDIADFISNERAGDSADILVADVGRADGALRYVCRSAGERVEQLYDAKMLDRPLHECLEDAMANAARPIWDACIQHRLPIYSIIPLADANGSPVTVEQIFLPYGGGEDGAEVMLGALHAWSTEGRFVSQGLLCNVAKVPLHWAVMVDPLLARVPRPLQDAGNNDIVFDAGLVAPLPTR